MFMMPRDQRYMGLYVTEVLLLLTRLLFGWLFGCVP
jgi:hypothetical protein